MSSLSGFVKAAAPHEQLVHLATSKGAQPQADVKRPRLPQTRVGASSLWTRIKKQIDIIESQPDSADRWLALAKKLGRDHDINHEISEALDVVIDIPSDALRLLALVGGGRS